MVGQPRTPHLAEIGLAKDAPPDDSGRCAKIIFPPDGVSSARKAFFKMVDTIEAPDDETLVFKLKFPTGAFIAALATPFNYTYSAKDLKEHGYDWHEKNVNGTGAFKFIEAVAGSHVEAVKFDDFHMDGKPYLDGYKALISRKMAIRVQAIRGDRAAIETDLRELNLDEVEFRDAQGKPLS